jgi:hypothetical protein
MFKRRGTGTWVDAADARLWTGTAWRPVAFVRRRENGQWVQAWPVVNTIDFTLNKSSVSGVVQCDGASASCPFVTVVTSESVTAAASSGTPTYLWQYVSGSTGVTVSNTTAATVTFSANVSRRATVEAIWQCTVTSGTQSKVLLLDISLFYDYERTPGEIEP